MRELSHKLVYTIQKLQKYLRNIVFFMTLQMATSNQKRVSKGNPILLDQYFKTFKSSVTTEKSEYAEKK